MSDPIENKPNDEALLDDDRGVVLSHVLSPKKRLVLKVSANTSVRSLAGSIYNAIIIDHREIALNAIGHGAVGQSIKGVIAAQQMMSPSGKLLFIRPGFEKDSRNMKDGDENLSITKLAIHVWE